MQYDELFASFVGLFCLMDGMNSRLTMSVNSNGKLYRHYIHKNKIEETHMHVSTNPLMGF